MEIRKEERKDWTRAGQNRGTSQDLKAVSEALSYLHQKGLSTVEDLEAFLEASGKSAADYRSQMKSKEARSILYRLLDEKSIAEYEAAEAAFTDVPADMWCSRYVSTIAKAGIVAGVGNGCFYPNDKLTWAQILTVLSRFTEPKACALQHIQYDGWAVEAVQTAVALGWIEDSADFAPNAIISRGDFMQLVNGVLTLYRAV